MSRRFTQAERTVPQDGPFHADGEGMPVHGHAQCAHCGALLSGDRCTICGKSVHETVELVDAAPARPGMSDESRRQIRNFGIFVATAALLGAGVFYVLTRETVEPTPTALAIPDTTTTAEPTPVESEPVVTRPGADAAPLPTLPATDAVEREVGDAVNPWNGAPPRNVLTGELLENTDYAPGIAAVTAILEAQPSGFVIGAPTTTEWNGVDLVAAEGTQPFAARGVADETGPITDLWIFARGESTTDGAAAYFDDARAQWPIDQPIDAFSPRPGIRLHQIGAFGGAALWVDVRDTWMIVYQAPVGVDPGLLGAISETWG